MTDSDSDSDSAMVSNTTAPCVYIHTVEHIYIYIYIYSRVMSEQAGTSREGEAAVDSCATSTNDTIRSYRQLHYVLPTNLACLPACLPAYLPAWGRWPVRCGARCGRLEKKSSHQLRQVSRRGVTSKQGNQTAGRVLPHTRASYILHILHTPYSILHTPYYIYTTYYLLPASYINSTTHSLYIYI